MTFLSLQGGLWAATASLNTQGGRTEHLLVRHMEETCHKAWNPPEMVPRWHRGQALGPGVQLARAL